MAALKLEKKYSPVLELEKNTGRSGHDFGESCTLLVIFDDFDFPRSLRVLNRFKSF